MRCVLAAPVLAACLLLATSASAAESLPALSGPPDTAASVSPDATPPAPAIPEPPAMTATPESQAADAAPPPFMRPHVAKSAPIRPDLTFASKPGPKGFRGLDWGMALAEAKARASLAPVTDPVTLKDTFLRPDELLKLGLADLRTVAYYFPKGRFAGVGITFEGEANFFLVKDYLIELYGPGRQVGDRYGWTWKDCNIDLRLKAGAGELRYTYEP
jgi:hypothetical protein